MFFMASALWISSQPVIYPLLAGLLEGGGTPSNYGTPSSYGSPVHALAFCGVFLAVYVLAVVSTHFPESRTVSLTSSLSLSLTLSLFSDLSGFCPGKRQQTSTYNTTLDIV